MEQEQVQVVQAVVDRLTSYQSTAPEGTVAAELRQALDEAGVGLTADQVDRLALAVEGAEGAVDVTALLG